MQHESCKSLCRVLHLLPLRKFAAKKEESVFSLAMGHLCLTPCISALLLKLLPVPLNSFTDRCVFLSNCIDFTCFRPLDYLWRLTSQGHLHEMFWMVMPKPFPTVEQAMWIMKSWRNNGFFFRFFFLNKCQISTVVVRSSHLTTWWTVVSLNGALSIETAAESMCVILHELCLDIYSLQGQCCSVILLIVI